MPPISIRQPTSLSFKERAGVRMGLYSGLFIPIPTLILPLKGRKLIFDHGAKRPLLALLLRKSKV
jgi:hypothetical protein